MPKKKEEKKIVDEEERLDGNKRRNVGFHRLQNVTNDQRHDSYIANW